MDDKCREFLDFAGIAKLSDLNFIIFHIFSLPSTFAVFLFHRRKFSKIFLPRCLFPQHATISRLR